MVTSSSQAASVKQRRALWLKIHRYLGLVFLLFMVLMGITGSINVYHRDIDAWLYPAFYTPVGQGSPLPLQDLLERARAADSAPVATILLPYGDRGVVLMHHQHHDDHTTWRTSLDPATGAVLGRRDQTHALLPTIYKLHEDLILKKYGGEWLVGIFGVVLMISSFSGLYLWWPRPGRWRKAVTLKFATKGLGRWLLDVHNVVGFWSCAIMVPIAFTGFCMSFPLAVRAVVRVVSPVRSTRGPKFEPGSGPSANVDEILAIARAHCPDAIPLDIDLPDKETPAWRVAMRPAGSHPASSGRIILWIDPWKREIVFERSPAQSSLGEWLIADVFPLHNGSLLGRGGQVLVFWTGLALPLLSLTGGLIWLHRRRLQRQALLRRGSHQAIQVLR